MKQFCVKNSIAIDEMKMYLEKVVASDSTKFAI